MSARQTPLPPQHLHTDSEAEPVWRWIMHMLAIWGRNQHASFLAIPFADPLLPTSSRHVYDQGHVPHLVNEGGSYSLGKPFQGVRSSSRGPQTVPAYCEHASPRSPGGLRLACGPPPRERRGARDAPASLVGRRRLQMKRTGTRMGTSRERSSVTADGWWRAVHVPLGLNEAVAQHLWNSSTVHLDGSVSLIGNPSLSSVLET